MPRSSWYSVILLLVATQFAPAQDEFAALQSFQKITTRVIQQTENSIACVLVSRSEFHPRDAKNPGRLGIYDPDKLLIDPKTTLDERLALRKKLDLAEATNVPSAFGSGVVIDAGGLVLTNFHVVQDASKIFVRLPGGIGSYADIHAADARCDLAVLKLLNPNLPLLKPIPLGDADQLQRGQFILTLANPYAAGFRDGLPSASWGLLSNIRRRAPLHAKEEERIKPLHYYGTLLQTDARLNLGSSGGAMLNLKGELIGLLTSLAAIHGGETPGGFAIPIDSNMRPIIEALKKGEEIDYGFLGVNFDEPLGNGQPGVILKTVGRNSPAQIDGKLEIGDVLLAVNGQMIQDIDDAFLFIGRQLAGSKIKLQVRRGANQRTAEVTLAKLYVPGKRIASSTGSRPFFRGLRVDHTSLVVQQPSRWLQIPRGVLVTEVLPNTPAHRANLKPGDVIIQVNQYPVATPASFYQATASVTGAVELLLYNDPPNKVVLK